MRTGKAAVLLAAALACARAALAAPMYARTEAFAPPVLHHPIGSRSYFTPGRQAWDARSRLSTHGELQLPSLKGLRKDMARRAKGVFRVAHKMAADVGAAAVASAGVSPIVTVFDRAIVEAPKVGGLGGRGGRVRGPFSAQVNIGREERVARASSCYGSVRKISVQAATLARQESGQVQRAAKELERVLQRSGIR